MDEHGAMTADTPIFAEAILDAGAVVAKRIEANALMVFIDAVHDVDRMLKMVTSPTKIVWLTRTVPEQERAQALETQVLAVPNFDLARMDQIKMCTLLALSHGLIRKGETFVFLTGPAGKHVDTLVAMEVGVEHELFQSINQPKLTEHIRRVVFEKTLTLMLELANEGREGKPVGALMVIGDHREVLPHCQEGRINPFKGYAEKERNLLDDSIHDTVKELAKLDGAFIVKGNGVIISAGTILRPKLVAKDLPQGLGARHSAAAAITACTKSIALTVSESTGTLRIWRLGEMITEIEKAPKIPSSPETPPRETP